MMKLEGGQFERGAMAYLYEAFAPQLQSPYRIERHYVAGLAKRFKDMFQEIRKLDDDSYVAFEPGVFFLNRLQFGFYSVLARLDVEVDYNALDAEILADVYLLMTGGQTSLFGGEQEAAVETADFEVVRLPAGRPQLSVVQASASELSEHEARLDALDAKCAEGAVWRRPATGPV